MTSITLRDVAGITSWLLDLFPDEDTTKTFAAVYDHLRLLCREAKRIRLAAFAVIPPIELGPTRMRNLLRLLDDLAYEVPHYDALWMARRLSTLRDHLDANGWASGRRRTGSA